MTTTVIKHHSDANDYLKKISIRSIKDVRALDVEGGSANRIEHQPVVVSTRFRYRYQAHHTQ